MKQVLALIFIPLSVMAFAMFVLFSIDLNQFSETIEMVVIFAFIIIAMALSLFVILRIISANAILEYDNRFVNITLDKKSFLYPAQEFHFNYSNIENAALDEDAQARIFITIKLRNPNKSILLSMVKADEQEQFLLFWNGFSEQIKSYNGSAAEHPELKIKSIGFYGSKWTKLLAIVSVVAAIIFTIVKILNPDKLSTLKLIAFYCYALPFVVSVYSASKKIRIKNKNR